MTSDNVSLLALIISILSLVFSFIVYRRTALLTTLEKKNKFLGEYSDVVQLGRKILEEMEQLKLLCPQQLLEKFKVEIHEVKDLQKKAEDSYKLYTNENLIKNAVSWESVMHNAFQMKRDGEEQLERAKKLIMEIKSNPEFMQMLKEAKGELEGPVRENKQRGL